MILTGMRQLEQFSLRWEHVDMQRGVLTLPTTKAGGVCSGTAGRPWCDYAHLSPSYLQEAVEKVSAFGKAEVKEPTKSEGKREPETGTDGSAGDAGSPYSNSNRTWNRKIT